MQKFKNKEINWQLCQFYVPKCRPTNNDGISLLILQHYCTNKIKRMECFSAPQSSLLMNPPIVGMLLMLEWPAGANLEVSRGETIERSGIVNPFAAKQNLQREKRVWQFTAISPLLSSLLWPILKGFCPSIGWRAPTHFNWPCRRNSPAVKD